MAAQQPKKVIALAKHLEASLKEMKAEMPTKNPKYQPRPGAYHLEQTKKLAEKNNRIFKQRLNK
ncbi:hypothetical protein [Paraglaciecola sp. L3A3]|uniref:hypothetical protein n=1 Tax=Paraglaciecola sp. L3A3 TaxID=2686358 RepID=UPI00131D2C38|nr:hypothetical protein [Paraglaciecola sp. L3A3]